jgi:hypothetical protein
MKILPLYYILLFTLPIIAPLSYVLSFHYPQVNHLITIVLTLLLIIIGFASLVLIASSLIIYVASVFVKPWTEEYPFAKKILVVGLIGLIMAFISFFVFSLVQGFFGLELVNLGCGIDKICK